jgi:alpha-glucoside transport system substrate-binding protein
MDLTVHDLKLGVSRYPNKVMRDVAKIGYGATIFRFDGSDAMPGAVGAGSFWKG